MRHHANLSARFTRVRGVAKRLFVVAVLLLAIMGVVVYMLSRPERLARMASAVLSDATGGDVTIDNAHLNWDGSLRLDGVLFRIPDNPDKQVQTTLGPTTRSIGDASRLFTVDQIHIDHSLQSLLRGTFRVNSLTLVRPTVYLTQLTDGTYNFSLLHPRKTQESGERPQIPEVFIKEASIQFAETDASGVYRANGKIELSGSMVALRSSPSTFKFTLREEGIGDATRPKLTGQFNLETMVVQAKLQDLQITREKQMMLPRIVREYCDAYKPSGIVPEMSYSYDPSRSPQRKASLVLNRGEMDFGLERAGVRMADVSGVFELEDEKLFVRTLKGRVADIDYKIDGEVRGLSTDAPFNLNVAISPFVLPEKPSFLIAMPDRVHMIFRRFAPSGVFTASVKLARDNPAGEISYRGDVDVDRGKLKFKGFPYQLDELHGKLSFTNEEVLLKDMRGRGPTGARVLINARIAPPADGASLDMTVRAEGMPLDEELRKCMFPWQVEQLDRFMDKSAHERWEKQDLLQSSKTALRRKAQLAIARDRRRTLADTKAIAAADEAIVELERLAKIPVFDLGGTLNLDVHVTRAVGEHTDYVTSVDVDVTGAGVIFAPWPYPLRLTGGKVLIRPHSVEIKNVTCDGLTGLRGTIDGVIRGDPKDGSSVPDVKVRAMRAPLDELLLGTIKPPRDALLRAVNLDATLDMSGAIFRNDNREIDFSIDVGFTNAKAQPLGGRVKLTDVKGKATITGEGVDVHSIEAKRGDATLAVTGKTRWDGPSAGVETNVRFKELLVDETLADVLPKNLEATAAAREMIEAYKPVGVVSGSMSYKKPDASPSASYRVTLEPRSLSFDFKKQRVTLAELKGSATVTPDGVRLDAVSAKAGDVTFGVSGTIGGGRMPELDLSFNARSNSIDPLTRAAVPPAVASLIDRLSIKSGYELTDATLKRSSVFATTTQPGVTSRQVPTTTFAGKLRLTNASANLGLPVTEAGGTIDLGVTTVGDDTPPNISAAIAIGSLRAAGRRIAPLTANIASAEPPGVIRLKDLRGKLYGGELLTTGDFDTRGDGRYRLQASVSEVPVDGLTNPARYEELLAAQTAPASTQRSDARSRGGKLTMSVSLDGVPDKPESRKGRGQFEIREANLYEIPTLVAILQLFQFTLPSTRSIDTATSQFLVDGDIVRFEAIKLASPSLEIIGAGTMRYSTTALDINLNSRNPQAPDLGAFSKVLTGLKDQLVHIHVGGTLAEPRPSLRPLSGPQRINDEPPPVLPKTTQREGAGADKTSDQ